MSDTPVITVECVATFDPPMIRVTIAGQQSFDVSTGVYQVIKGPLGLPDDPCLGLPHTPTD